MVNNNDINVKDSTIKKFIDGWYSMTLKGTEYEKIPYSVTIEQ